MSDYDPPIIETRRDQIFPHLDTDRRRARVALRRVAPLRHRRGTGVGRRDRRRSWHRPLRGQVDVYRYDAHGRRQHFFTFGPGAFLGELAQLAGRPSFGDAVAREPVKALIFSPDRMRALLIAEAGARRTADARADSAARRKCCRMASAGRSSSAAPKIPTCCGSRAFSRATPRRT